MNPFQEKLVIENLFQFLEYTKDYDIISFDLFDTLIYRRYFEYNEIKSKVFHFIVNLTDNRYNFEQVKFTYEHINNLLKDSRRISSDEPFLIDIYKTVLSALKVDEFYADTVVQYELNLEKRNLSLFDDVLPCLEQLKEVGKKIVILSDMYFSESQIRQILSNLEIERFFDEVYVSSEYKERKYTSKLFRVIFDDTSNVLHVGDNENNDYKQALKSKVDAIHLVRRRQPQVSATLPVTYVDSEGGLLELMSEIFATMIANVFEYAFTHNIPKILFLSRDATPLHILAKKFLANRKNSIYNHIKIDELCIGRNSLGYLDVRSGKYFLEDVLDQYSWLHHGKVKLLNLLNDFEIKSHNLPECLVNASWSNRRSAQNIANTIMNKDLKLYSKIEEYILNQNHLALEYLSSMGAVGNGKVVFVDIGYSGTVLRYIAHHLTREAASNLRMNTDIHMLMLATTDNYIGNSHLSQPYGVIREGLVLTQASLPNILKTNFSWLEVFFKDYYPQRGPLLRYKRQDDSVIPVFKEIKKDAVSNILLHKIIDLADKKLEEDSLIKYLDQRYLIQIRNLTIETFSNPSKGVINVMKTLRQEFSPLQTEVKGILFKANSYKTLKKIDYMIQNDYWVAGSFKENGIGNLIPKFDEIKESKNKFPYWFKLTKEKLGVK